MNSADYAEMLLAGAEEFLTKNPLDNLHFYTSLNISGGFESWNATIWKICSDPADAEEGIQKLRLQDVLVRAIENNFEIFHMAGREKTKSLSLKDEHGWDTLANLTEIFRNIFVLAQLNPAKSLPYKMKFLLLLKKRYDLTAAEFVQQHFKKFCWISDNWQEIF